MKKFLKTIINPIFFLFVDRYSYSPNINPYKNFIKLCLYTSKYKLASLGIFLSKNEKILAGLKDKHRGERCFLIGNGPSLNLLDLTKLKSEYTFGVNAIYLNYEKMQFHPTYYVVEDYLVAEDRCKEINAYKAPVHKFYGTYLDYVLQKDEKSIFLNVLMNYSEPFEPFFSQNPVRSLGVGGSVTFICLQLAFYMGFKEVYMIGFDHNYKVPEADIDDKKVILSKEDDVNHFAPGYFGKGYRWHDPRVDRMTQGFSAARLAFEKDGRAVYNATAGGHLETFERVKYETLF
ncbi:6-hydroxymethylpterin diphosphokinase MptE-like protein [Limnovirga soli]|jgi:hypothetical protein|uniref:DUF115 domain-containing protein n=1 Tax=Limnovirga soli TaxID=2656915 RepID=A0A8J8JTU8_9BACT|nr:6-hydroxymethylpterin diphosphokinase MptE-like protein [Limnovirga soli]NNV54904.1 DUF115 domain-containing protein [Limnovirga soli]